MSASERQLIVIAHNLRSCHNVGSLLRTAEGLGVQEVILTGYTPYPLQPPGAGTPDGRTQVAQRLPHEAARIDRQIHKTALGAEITQPWRRETNVFTVISLLRADGWTIAALEQTDSSVALPTYHPPAKLAIILGREVEGTESEVLDATDLTLEIPMSGSKESFNVIQAAAMALYHCRCEAIANMVRCT